MRSRRRGRSGLTNAAFDHRKSIDDLLDCALNRFERVLGAGDVAFDRALRGGHWIDCPTTSRPADIFDMDKEVSNAALDRFEMNETRIGRIEALHERRNAIFEMRKRCMIGVGQLDPFQFFDQPGEQFLQFARHRLACVG